MKNIWYDLKGYEGIYRINLNGDVYSVLSNKILKHRTYPNGYKNVSLHLDKKEKVVMIHRLIMNTFNPLKYLKGLCVNHIDGDKSNNKLSNLEWTTIGENVRLAYKNGLSKRSFNKEQADQIRLDYSTGNYTQVQLAKKYSIGKSCCAHILHNRTHNY